MEQVATLLLEMDHRLAKAGMKVYSGFPVRVRLSCAIATACKERLLKTVHGSGHGLETTEVNDDGSANDQ